MSTKKLLPTSTAGSLPKPSWLAEPEKLWSPWKLQDDGLIEGKQDALRLSLQEQQHAGIDIVSDGEQTRQQDRKSTRLNSSHSQISYAVFCLKKKKKQQAPARRAAHRPT